MTAAPAAHHLTTLPAQSMDAIAVHLPQPAMAGGRMLSPGNYMVSTLRGVGEVPILRFQSETGESIAVLVTREDLPIEEASERSEVMVSGDGGGNVLRVAKIAIAGLPFEFVVADLSNYFQAQN